MFKKDPQLSIDQKLRTEQRSIIIQVTEEQHISLARQATRYLAEKIGFRQLTSCYVATSVSELANNLVFHATQGGTITLRAFQRLDKVGIEVVAEDNGPGIADVELAMQDNYSTNGGLGGGLPGVARLMDEFKITSTVGVGTCVVARKWQQVANNG